MLLKKLPLQTFVKNIRSKILPKKLLHKSVVQSNRTEMLCSKNYRSKRLSKISVDECCWKKYLESVATNNRTQSSAQKTAARNVRQR